MRTEWKREALEWSSDMTRLLASVSSPLVLLFLIRLLKAEKTH
jgi:hypothetical protein